ncbi:MAG: glyoxylate/hydroxypyruvate reductase A, partial [Pseudomonadota bacterium]
MIKANEHPPVLLDIKWDIVGKKEAFEAALPDRAIVLLDEARAQNAPLNDVRYAVVWQPEPGLFASLPALEVIFSLGAGVDHVVRDPQLPDLPLVRFVDSDLTGRMVEWVVLQVLLHLRRQRTYDRQQRERNWHEVPQPAAHQFRVGIMGLGTLGQACAKVLAALGFQVNGWARSAKTMDGVTSFAGQDQLDGFLSHTDILVNLLPLTEDTRGILSRPLLEKLARNGPFKAPVLINAGRGGSQVEADIVSCLQDGTLFGASLDVFETEPLPKESPLWGFDNVIITPHMAAVSDPAALARHVAKQISRYENGQPLEHVVDRSRGY